MSYRKIIHGDCLDVLKRVLDHSIDLVICDPPYGMFAKDRVLEWDIPIDLTRLWMELLRIGKENTAYIFFSKQPYTSTVVKSNLKLFRYELIWQKEQGTNFGDVNRKPLYCHENLSVFYKKQPTYHKQTIPGIPYKKTGITPADRHALNFKSDNRTNEVYDGNRAPVSVIKIPRDTMKQGANLYPTQKPVALMEWLIESFSNKGAWVLDPTMGGGTTGVACGNTQRNFIGIDKSSTAFQIAKKRLSSH